MEDSKIIIHRSYIEVTNYMIGSCLRLEQSLSKKERFYKYTPKGYIYDNERNRLLLPAGLDIWYIEKLLQCKAEKDYSMDEFDNISIRLVSMPRSDLQSDLIQFLIGEGDFEIYRNSPQLVGVAATGEGKTFCAIAAMLYLRLKTMIIVNRKNIRDKWIMDICEYTDARDSKLVVVTTSLMEEVADNPAAIRKSGVIFIVTHKTLQVAGDKHGWDFIGEVFRALGIGLKIYDEAHMEMLNTIRIDAHTNTFKTFYLTATFERNREENHVFQLCYKNLPKFNQSALGYNDSKKHIMMILCMYNSKPDIEGMCSIKSKGGRGVNAHNYAMYQVERDGMFFHILDGLIDKFLIKNKFRVLILTGAIKACDVILDRYIDIYPEIRAGTYNSSIKSDVKAEVLKSSQLIVSIPASLGFAETIDNLQVVINCTSFSNYTLSNQASGRLRKDYENLNKLYYYIELIDNGHKSIKAQFREREKRYVAENAYKEMAYLDMGKAPITKK